MSASAEKDIEFGRERVKPPLKTVPVKVTLGTIYDMHIALTYYIERLIEEGRGLVSETDTAEKLRRLIPLELFEEGPIKYNMSVKNAGKLNKEKRLAVSEKDMGVLNKSVDSFPAGESSQLTSAIVFNESRYRILSLNLSYSELRDKFLQARREKREFQTRIPSPIKQLHG